MNQQNSGVDTPSSNDDIEIEEAVRTIDPTTTSQNLVSSSTIFKTACTEYAILDYGPFRSINGIRFKNLAEKIFIVGQRLPVLHKTNIKNLLPHSRTISRHIDNLYDEKHQQLILICEKLIVYTFVLDFWKDT
ncbi:unnamed protein product [Adineta steineri]|uniref:Uncharacterized protein n=1 Tax=Adineta steineri TaxID=433720 RepID=A0A813N6Z6_9BILA|nr:unnamed protein product [Adineta steineri]